MDMTFKFKESEEYVHSVVEYLTKTFGEVKECWKPIIIMLGNEHDIYQAAKADVEANGLRIQTARGNQKNPSIIVMHDSLVQQQKLANSLGITPNSSIKLKMQSPGQEEDEEDYLDSLIS